MALALEANAFPGWLAWSALGARTCRSRPLQRLTILDAGLALADTPRPTETLEIFPSLGLQLASCTVHHVSLPVTQTKPWTVRSSRKAHLIPLEHIGKIVVNEGLQGAGGRHYLAVVGNGGEGERRVFVLFPVSLSNLSSNVPR